MKKINQVYHALIDAYGKQGWWPVTDKGEVFPEYKKRKAFSEKQMLEVCIGAILTQNTSWTNVEKAIMQLNKNKLINVNKLAKIDQSKLAQLIRSSGYFNQKAERLILFAKYLLNNYSGSINKFFNKPLQNLRQELLSMHGIGPETADSIILYAAKKPVFVIDAYTKRIFSRLGFCEKDISYHELQKMFHERLDCDFKLFNEFHALIVKHAKQYCKKKPECNNCPLNSKCQKTYKHKNLLNKHDYT
ncbi:hypothetical protein HYV79_03135 [Candidatus Woesearchaeota archaeon]|nr:hypothetical protein [Candidatus Woesearchaeota archaeon]